MLRILIYVQCQQHIMYWCMHNWFRVCVLGLQACHLATLFFEKAMFGLAVNLIMCAKVHVFYMFFLWALGGKVWFPQKILENYIL